MEPNGLKAGDFDELMAAMETLSPATPNRAGSLKSVRIPAVHGPTGLILHVRSDYCLHQFVVAYFNIDILVTELLPCQLPLFQYGPLANSSG